MSNKYELRLKVLSNTSDTYYYITVKVTLPVEPKIGDIILLDCDEEDDMLAKETEDFTRLVDSMKFIVKARGISHQNQNVFYIIEAE